MRSIEASQIEQVALDTLVVRIVRRPEYTQRDEQSLVEAFKARLGDAMRIEVVYVDALPREASGKFRWVISSIPPRF
jgi:phenylacetate-CoA ligase